MRLSLLCLALIFAGCTSAAAVTPTLRGPIVPTRVIPTDTPTPTATLTYTPTATWTPSLTPSPTETPTAIFTASATPTPSETLRPTATPTFTPTLTSTPGQLADYPNSTSFEQVLMSGPVTLGTPIFGTIDDQHPFNLYTLDANAGDIIDIDVTKQTDSFDSFLVVLDPKGRMIAYNDDANKDTRNSQIHGLTIQEPGTYAVIVTRYGQEFGGSSGPYELSLKASPAGEASVGTFPAPTGYESLLTGTLGPDKPDQAYSFRATAGDVITIQMSKTSGDLDSHLTLLNNLGTTIADNEDNLLLNTLDAAIQSYVLPKSGFYTIVAARFSGDNNAGDYRLKLAREGSSSNQLIAILDPINSGTVDENNATYVDYSAGDTVDSNNQEHSLQTLLTFRLPPPDPNLLSVSADFDLKPCLERGGGFATLGELTVYQDNYGTFALNDNLFRPLPGAHIITTQTTCDTIDLSQVVVDAYNAGDQNVQLRLMFRNNKANNGQEDQISFTPRLTITFAK